jgi:hypothetical protein
MTNEFPNGQPSGDYTLTVLCQDASISSISKSGMLVEIINIEANAFNNIEVAKRISLKTFFEAFGAETIKSYLA